MIDYWDGRQGEPEWEPECSICGSPLDDNDVCLDIGNEKCINSIREPFEVM